MCPQLNMRQAKLDQIEPAIGAFILKLCNNIKPRFDVRYGLAATDANPKGGRGCEFGEDLV